MSMKKPKNDRVGDLLTKGRAISNGSDVLRYGCFGGKLHAAYHYGVTAHAFWSSSA